MKFKVCFLLFLVIGVFFVFNTANGFPQTSSTPLNVISNLSTNATSTFATTTLIDLIKMKEEANKLHFSTSADDLEKAGFTNVIQMKPKPEIKRFELPVQYFTVDQKISENEQKNDCADCASLVSVYVTPVVTSTTLPLWAIKNNPEIGKVAGRTQIKTLVAGRIIYIASPDSNLGLKLANILRERIILNQTFITDK